VTGSSWPSCLSRLRDSDSQVAASFPFPPGLGGLGIDGKWKERPLLARCLLVTAGATRANGPRKVPPRNFGTIETQGFHCPSTSLAHYWQAASVTGKARPIHPSIQPPSPDRQVPSHLPSSVCFPRRDPIIAATSSASPLSHRVVHTHPGAGALVAVPPLQC
jgi:hypothetical protein